MNEIEKRKTFILEGDSDHLDRIVALFEAEELGKLLGVNVLDAGKIVAPIPLPEIEASTIERLANRWQQLLNKLLQQQYQLAYRNGNILTKKVALGDRDLELLLQLEAIETDGIQLFIQIRPPHGQGYLPQGLEVSLMDESETILVSQTANIHTNILDLTQSNKIICDWTDRLIIGFKLGTESVRAYFPE
jgi:Protein of unknown function (DUF1822)